MYRKRKRGRSKRNIARNMMTMPRRRRLLLTWLTSMEAFNRRSVGKTDKEAHKNTISIYYLKPTSHVWKKGFELQMMLPLYLTSRVRTGREPRNRQSGRRRRSSWLNAGSLSTSIISTRTNWSEIGLVISFPGTTLASAVVLNLQKSLLASSTSHSLIKEYLF